MTGLEFARVDRRITELWERDARTDIADAIRAGAPSAGFADERSLLTEFRMHLFRGSQAFVLTVDGVPHTLLIAGFHKRARPGWGRYVNVQVVHTHRALRGSGGATAAYRAFADYAARRGYARLVTTAGSFGGWRTHRALAWPAWGINRNGQIVTDTALPGTPEPPGIPPACLKLAGPGRPLAPAEHAAILTDPHGAYRVPPGALPADYRREGQPSWASSRSTSTP